MESNVAAQYGSCVGSVMLLLSGAEAEAVSSDGRPNILFIMADDLGWGDPSCYGNKVFQTPSIDQLASQGALFTQFYQGGSVCSPSRASLLTGRWPADVEVHGHIATPQLNQERGMPDFLDPQTPTLPGLLQQAGYKTVHIGKWHLGYPERPRYQENWDLYPENADRLLADYGFELSRWIDCRDRETNIWDDRERSSKLLVDETCSVLTDLQDSDRPFYCQLWFIDPHAALAPSDEQMEPFRRGTPQGYTSPLMVYAGTVLEMDRQIGRLMEKLDELGLAENTLVIFSSDNGPEEIQISNAAWSGIGSTGPLRGRKRSLYDGGTRMPLIVRWPQGGIPAGQVNTETVVSGADLLPTLCEIGGADIPADVRGHLRGQSVAPAFMGDKTFERTEPIMWEWRYRVIGHVWNRSPILAIRDGRWKMLFNPDNSRIELFNLERDPGEQNNIAADHGNVVSRLKEQLLVWHAGRPSGPLHEEAGKNEYPWPSEEHLVGIKREERNSNSEAERIRGPLFLKLDQDQSGTISKAEFLRPFADKQDADRRFTRFDSDGNGELSRDEFIYGWKK